MIVIRFLALLALTAAILSWVFASLWLWFAALVLAIAPLYFAAVWVGALIEGINDHD